MIEVGQTYGKLEAAAGGSSPYAPIVPTITGGVTETFYCPYCRDLFVQITTTGVDSTNPVSVVVEGSLDNVGWDNLDANDAATVITSVGTTIFNLPGAITPYVRISGLTATGATVVAQVYFGSVS